MQPYAYGPIIDVDITNTQRAMVDLLEVYVTKMYDSLFIEACQFCLLCELMRIHCHMSSLLEQHVQLMLIDGVLGALRLNVVSDMLRLRWLIVHVAPARAQRQVRGDGGYFDYLNDSQGTRTASLIGMLTMILIRWTPPRSLSAPQRQTTIFIFLRCLFSQP